MSADPDRPAPEAFLKAAAREGRGRLKVFLGAAPGVGKTYEMLADAAQRRRDGCDVVVGVVETHGRAETEAMVRGHDVIPRRDIEYQGRTIGEMDLDAILARRPDLALVDELAHTNAPGSRHPKRYQDIDELLAAGIDVFTTLNIQHIESLNDIVASFTRVRVRETVPDRVLEDADIEVVDITPDELIARLKAGKVYVPEEASRALGHFFSKTNLSALRELALRRTAQAVDAEMLGDLRAQMLGGAWAAGDRVVVAVDRSAGAAEVVRAGKRLADALRAPWTVVHIETPRDRRLGDTANQRLAATLHLATSLGAVTASLPGATPVEGLCAFAADARATHIVIGKSLRSRWFELRHGSVVDELVRSLDGVTLHVIPGVSPTERVALARPAGGPWTDYAWSALAVAVTTGIGVSLGRFVGISNTALLFLVPVLGAASRFGPWAGLFTAALSSLAYNFFFLPPLYTFTIADPENIVTVTVFLGVAFVTSQLASRLRDQAALARESARQNAALAGFARILSGIADQGELAQALAAESARLFGAAGIVLLGDNGLLTVRAASPPEDRLDPVALAAAQWVFDKGLPAGRGSETLPAAGWLFHPLVAAGAPIGVLGLAREDGRPPVRSDQLPLLTSLLDQANLAFERARLAGEIGEIARLRDRDRLRASLLASVSHDLRTPLTKVVATIAELRHRRADEPLLDDLHAETQRLQRFVANLLDMARIEAGALVVQAEPIDLTDAVASAVHDLKTELAGHALRLDVAPNLPLVRADPRLLHHCLINLLDNAGKYADADAPVTVAATRTPGSLTIAVLDEGPGLPAGHEARLFETFTRLEGSDRSKTGTGLGLAIVKGFAEAMGMTVSAANRGTPRGAAFALHIPDSLLVRAGGAA